MNRKALEDLVERAGRTFAQTFLAVYAPVVLGAHTLGGLADLSVADKAATAGIAAVFSIVTSLVGAKVGTSDEDTSLR